MTKAPILAKWLLTITLVAMVLMTARSFAALVSSVGPEGERAIVLPVSYHAPGLSLQNEVLGQGDVIDSSGWVIFIGHLTSAVVIGYNLGALLALLPGLALVVLLRKIVVSVDRGEPFSARNISRIRAIGIIAIVAELVRGLVVLGIQAALADSIKTGLMMTVDPEWNLSIFVLGAVIVALAEVFRYGMQLQADVDLTV